MAIAYVQSQGTEALSGGATTVAHNLAANLVSGDIIVVWVGGSSGTLTTMNAVTNITWTVGASAVNAASNASCGIAIGVASALITSGTTITANISVNSTRRWMAVDEFSGVDTSSPLNTSNVASAAASADAAPSITTSGSGLCIVACNGMNDGSGNITDMTPPSSPAAFTETSDFVVGTTSKKHCASGYVLNQAAGTYSPTWTVATGTRGAAEGGAAALTPAAVIATPQRGVFFSSRTFKNPNVSRRAQIAWR